MGKRDHPPPPRGPLGTHPQVILEAWAKCIGDYGSFIECRNTLVTTASRTNGTDPLSGNIVGSAVGVTTLHFEAGEFLGRVSFDSNDLIDGIFILPTDATESVF